ncbi:MAG: PucR family transcriptional regulator [Marinobacter adhaerens]|uniref:PucR family transcriptional regulator n=1 Tax=Marinobacter adhaerens TaxID=1033846 RepID=A0A844I029_9GAMM|nr:PucR family transcriptional regulator [Marinobacter sp.]MBO6810816.1 PucR family transcriptional regulator [Marinobacter sp.]MBO6872845.1 PucR family transcriptional regulator [Marinobacter sp.]MTI99676.1 PucR family transcriptional regulator [Marinobacter adhaerens]
MTLRCRDVPLLPGLGAIRLRGGESAGDNPVRWPYVAENRSFKNWVKGGELVFVTGISRHRSPQNLAECLYEGKECNVSGLVVLTGDAYIGQLPNTLYRLADELEIPLFEQPYSLPMVEVTEALGRAIVWSEHTSIEQVDPSILAESTELLDAWIACRGNQSAMAEALDCHRNTIRNRMNQLSESLPGPGNTTEKFRTLLKAHLLLKP